MTTRTTYFNIIVTENDTGPTFTCFGPYYDELEQYRELQALVDRLYVGGTYDPQKSNNYACWAVVHNTGKLVMGRYVKETPSVL